mmetsp:Transcript_108942/g.213449  ORF Transcript_108942/g.213449 Transcript_108942/m.213449 type:complete len:220 (+) Transcript_108942:125-784(+)
MRFGRRTRAKDSTMVCGHGEKRTNPNVDASAVNSAHELAQVPADEGPVQPGQGGDDDKGLHGCDVPVQRAQLPYPPIVRTAVALLDGRDHALARHEPRLRLGLLVRGALGLRLRLDVDAHHGHRAHALLARDGALLASLVAGGRFGGCLRRGRLRRRGGRLLPQAAGDLLERGRLVEAAGHRIFRLQLFPPLLQGLLVLRVVGLPFEVVQASLLERHGR